MLLRWLCLLGLLYTCTGLVASSGSGNVFTSSFLVRFKKSVDNDLAHSIASRNGFENLGAVSYNKIFIIFIQYLISIKYKI